MDGKKRGGDPNTASQSKKQKAVATGQEDIPEIHDDFFKLLEEFPKEKFISILHAAALQHEDVLEAVRQVADKDPYSRMLMVHGLSADTTTQQLISVFSSYGELEEVDSKVNCEVVTINDEEGNTKVCGVVVFKHADCALLAMKEPVQAIDGSLWETSFLPSRANSLPNDIVFNILDRLTFGLKAYVATVCKNWCDYLFPSLRARLDRQRRASLRNDGQKMLEYMKPHETIHEAYNRRTRIGALFSGYAENFMKKARRNDPHYWTRERVQLACQGQGL